MKLFSTLAKRSLKICAALAVLLAGGAAEAGAEAPWRFGVIGDTQWGAPDKDGQNPDTVAAGIIRQIDAVFIAQKVSLVIAVGDLADRPSVAGFARRALCAKALYAAGIGFFPLRGNHDIGMPDSAAEFARAFPQIGTGWHPLPQTEGTKSLSSGEDFLCILRDGSHNGQRMVQKGKNFSTPPTNIKYKSLSYAFDFRNVRFVLLDPFARDGEGRYFSSINEQIGWIKKLLADPKRPRHAVVFGHKPLLGASHKDTLFGEPADAQDPGDAGPQQAPARNAFFAALAENNAAFFICGHDHLHRDSLLTSPDGKHEVRQLICASASHKFYAPRPPYSGREKVLSHEERTIGFYIFTVEGDRLSADYYRVDVSGLLDGKNALETTPELTGKWEKTVLP